MKITTGPTQANNRKRLAMRFLESPTRTFAELTLVCLFFTIPSACYAETSALAYDALTTPNKSVKLQAKFERNWGRFIRPDIRDTPVKFKMGGRVIGTVNTDDDGLATIAIQHSACGVFRWTAIMPSRKASVNGTLRVISRKQKVIVFDIDSTLSNLSEILVPVRGKHAKAYPYAPEFVRRVAKHYEIVYLTARDDTFSTETSTFLKRHQFPIGTVIHNEVTTDGPNGNQWKPSNHGRFKSATLKALKARGINLFIGVGNAKTDASAYNKVNIPAYIRGSSFPKATKFDSYSELEKIFIKKKWLSPVKASQPNK